MSIPTYILFKDFSICGWFKYIIQYSVYDVATFINSMYSLKDIDKIRLRFYRLVQLNTFKHRHEHLSKKNL